MKMKFSISDDIGMEEIAIYIKQGAKFVSYEYIISKPLFRPTKRISKLYFLKPGEKASKYAYYYNILSLFLGLWGLPFGPTAVISAFITNLKGGFDFTEDVLVNLNKESLQNKEIMLEKPARYFVEPAKSDLKEICKAIKLVKKNNFLIEPVIVGYFINTTKEEEAYYIIGISALLTDDLSKIISKEIYKRYYKNTKFKIVSLLENNDENIDRLKNEGVKLNFE